MLLIWLIALTANVKSSLHSWDELHWSLYIFLFICIGFNLIFLFRLLISMFIREIGLHFSSKDMVWLWFQGNADLIL